MTTPDTLASQDRHHQDTDVIVIGAGIAGASIGWQLAAHVSVTVLEREAQPGYHSTGRSAALLIDSRGSPVIRALTRASRALLLHPPPGFGEHPLLSPRNSLVVAARGDESRLDAHWAMLESIGAIATRLDTTQVRECVPVLRPERAAAGVLETGVFDMDVHAIHQGYLRGMRAGGGHLVCDARIESITRAGQQWEVQTGGVVYRAPVLVNAAGAWADEVASMAGVPGIGLQPRRRSAFLFAPPESVDTRAWPMTFDAAGGWYFKPEAGLLLGSPANEDPVPAQDVQPEEYDIALGIQRIEEATSLRIRRPSRTWAGLRSFVGDEDLVGGFDPLAPGFFWMAAQGGSGIKTSAAFGQACAALARSRPVPAHIIDAGLDPADMSPARLHRRTAA